MILKSNKFFRYGFIILSLILFAIIVIKAYDEYLFQINNRVLKKITDDSPPYRVQPEKTVNQHAVVEKIISDFVTENKYDIEDPIEPIIVPKKNKITTPIITQPEVTEESIEIEEEDIAPDEDTTPNKNIFSQENNLIDIKSDEEQNKDYLLQLGAYSNKENIATQVKKLKANFPSLLEDKKFFVKNTQKSLYKLFIGPFNDALEAKDFCSNLRKNEVSCFFVEF